MIIVGAGQAGLQVADSLRQEGFDGRILMFGEEAHAPYNRPPLSKKWLLERHDMSSIAIRGAEYLQRKQIELHTRMRVQSIDCESRSVQLQNGERVEYRGLALCTGARLRQLPLPGADLGGVLGLKTVDDALALSAALDVCQLENKPLIVIGGGFIGLEVAATACKRGVAVTVLEGLGRLMSRVVAPIVSEAARALHESHGVKLLFDVKIVALEGTGGSVSAVRLADGQCLPAGCVLVGVGVEQNDSLAVAAGIECDRGIVVDACSRTSAAQVVAVGDCTARRRPDGSFLRLESVQNAVEQGKAAAAALLGREQPFVATPWFWSDQHEMKLQMVGLSHGYDQVVTRGDVASRAFSAYYFRAGRLIAVDSLSRPPEHMMARKLLDRGLSPTPEQAADPSFNLQALLAAEKTP
jgi:3-phenylpropionate/trans-cinnamate dioxygenase ferredoxin reductase subunit